MANKKYKLAVMGATAVGKTVFFASYFYLTTQLGKGEYPVSIKNSGSVKEIGRIIRKLFEEHSIPEGTATRTDVSFDVDLLDMEVEFYDVPGGHTQDMDQWVEQKILPDLEQANGVLFFISSEDALLHQDRLVNDNMVFSRAITELRKSLDAKGRQDVPIWFLFTKGDLVPEKSIDELAESIPALLNAAGKSGKFVRCWKVTSMGKWINPSAPPREYKPENVLEPMEEMLQAMKKSGKIFTRKVRMITGLSLLASWLALVGAGWLYDQYRWKSARSTVEQHIELSRFPEALDEMKGFYDRFKLPSILLPSFLSAGPEAEAVLNDIYTRYESSMFKDLKAFIDGADINSVPSGTPDVFRKTVEKIREYLAQTNFYKVNPANYEQVRSVQNYFETGLVLLTDMNELVTASTQEEIFNALIKQLDLASRIPMVWQEKIEVKADELLRAWVHSFSWKEAPASELGKAISAAEMLLGNPYLPEKLKAYLSAQKDLWEPQRIAVLENESEGWQQEAGRMDPQQAIEFLTQKQMQQTLTAEIRQKLAEAVDMHYGRLADAWLTANNGPTELRDLLASFPYMPFEHKGRVEDRIRIQMREKIEGLLSELSGARTIDDLLNKIDAVKETKKMNAENASVISGAFEASVLKIVENEIKAYSDEASVLASRRDFGGAKHKVESLFGGLASKIRRLSSEMEKHEKILIRLEERKTETLLRLEEAEYASCRSVFNLIRNTREKSEIRRCIDHLKSFVSHWPSSAKSQEMLDVQTFLEYIQGGVPVRLVIVNGDFTAEDSIVDTPDIYIELRNGDSLVTKTDTILDKKQPNFNHNYSFEWELTTSFTFVGYDEDGIKDDEVFRVIVPATGLFGYKKLMGDLKSEGNVLRIWLEHSIPKCPWE